MGCITWPPFRRLVAAERSGTERSELRLEGRGEEDHTLAALAWRSISAAALPVILGEERLVLPGGGRLLGEGRWWSRWSSPAIRKTAHTCKSSSLRRSHTGSTAGLLFGLVPFTTHGAEPVTDACASTAPPCPRPARRRNRRRGRPPLANPLVLVWDVESVLQTPFAAAPGVRLALAEARRALAEFSPSLPPQSRCFTCTRSSSREVS